MESSYIQTSHIKISVNFIKDKIVITMIALSSLLIIYNIFLYVKLKVAHKNHYVYCIFLYFTQNYT